MHAESSCGKNTLHRAPWESTRSQSQFCENGHRFAKSFKCSMRQIHRAGEEVFLDYSGPTSSSPPEARRATPSPCHAVRDFFPLVGGHGTGTAFYAGVLQLIVPDNPRELLAS